MVDKFSMGNVNLNHAMSFFPLKTLRSILVFLIGILIGGCATTSPTYYTASLMSSLNGQHKFKLRKSTRYCTGKKDKNGEYIYPDFCNDKNGMLYRTYGLATMGAHETAKTMCMEGKAQLVGHEQIKEYVGMTGSYCYGPSNTTSNTYGPSNTYDHIYDYNSSCTGPYPIYNFSIDIYFQCLPTKNPAKQSP